MPLPTRRAIGVLCAALLPWLVTHAGDKATPKAGGPAKPLSPAEAVKLFKLDAGLRIELVAAEPTVQSPVAMAFGADGRMWVVEMHDYPNGPAPGQPPQGRVRILEDRDGDGFYEHGSTFADGLLFANGLLPWKDGVIVTAAPHIVHLRDTDGDGKADRRDVWFEGFAAQNPQLRVSHPVLGLDGWVYVANGLRGGMVKKAGTSDPPINLSGMDFRFDPVTLKGEPVSGLGQFGNTFDAWGRRFVCDNRHHLRHVVFENRYLKRNPLLAAPSLVEDISVLDDGPLSSGGKIYPLSRNWTTSSLHEGRFTAACGVHIYEGTLLGERYKGAALTCDPTGNLVHLELLTPKGATFTARPHKQGVEFLATPDDWFRPVFLATGPDDALYVVDMYRAVIEHPEFMPPELKNRPDLVLGKDKGRIWRIVPEKHQTKAIRPDLDKAGPAELVTQLTNEEPWWRATAQRLLLERQDSTTAGLLAKRLDSTEKPFARLNAAYLLDRLGKLDAARLLKLLGDGHPRLREHAVLLTEKRLDPSAELRNVVVALAEDRDARVRYQVALSLGETREDVTEALVHIALAGSDDKWTRLAVLSSVGDDPAALLVPLLQAAPAGESPGRREMIRETAALVGAEKDGRSYHRGSAAAFAAGKDVEQRADALAAVVGLVEGLERRGKTLLSAADEPDAKKYRDSLRSNAAEFLKWAAGRVANKEAEAAELLPSIRILGHAQWDDVRTTLVPLATDDPRQEVRLAALRAVARRGEKDVPAVLMQTWRGATPALRREILEAMLQQRDRTLVLLDEVAAKRVKASEIDAVRARQLVSHKDPAIRERATKLLRESLPADRQAALKQYQMALKLDGDAKRGREIFRKNCATCHRVGGVGVDVGPDIADTRTKTLDALLTDILLPNQAIDNNYVNYLVTTSDGRVLTGVLAAETASSLTLKRAEGQSDTVLRRDVDEIVSTGVSLMPEGLEKGINLQEMADLLSYLKNWRYLDGSVPVGR